MAAQTAKILLSVFLYRDNSWGQEHNEVRIVKYDIERDEIVKRSRNLWPLARGGGRQDQLL